MLLWTAFLLGIMGSTHCVGMCGPLVLALPLSSQQKWQMLRSALQYNFGRILTYALLGLVVGILGRGIFIAGFQQWLSIGLGIFLLVLVVFRINLESRFLQLPFVQQYNLWLKRQLSKCINRPNGHFLLGLLNGLLPCGLVYMALAGAVTTNDPLSGMLFMALFGLGTLPLLLSLFFITSNLKGHLRHRLQKISTFVLLGTALLLLFRGFAIEFPTELRFWEALNNPVMCH
jgi:sulfite exporter TauE/SafE